MFENFTFGSTASDTAPTNVTQCTSAEISPYTSRCSSPKLAYDAIQPSLTYAGSRRDSRFDTYRPPRHPSVTALTAQLEHHAISAPTRPDSPVSMPSPGDSASDQDEGFYDGPETPSTSGSDYTSDFDPSLWDLSMCDLSATSSPRPSLSLEAQATNSYSQRRRQRQALVRLQCLATRTPDIAILLEECHPSSLSLAGELPWMGSTSRSNSIVSMAANGNGRIEKERHASVSSVRRPTRMRKRTTR